MPESTITIERDQRDGLYELVRNHLASIEDFWVALERTRDFVTTERLGLEFGEDFLLLQDLGWGEHDERESFELTMPPHDLMEVLRRLPRGRGAGPIRRRGAVSSRRRRHEQALSTRLRDLREGAV
jgi:hypothetical protein